MRSSILVATAILATALSTRLSAQNLLPPLGSPQWQSATPCNPILVRPGGALGWLGCSSIQASCPNGLDGPTCLVQISNPGWYQLRLRMLDYGGWAGSGSSHGHATLSGPVTLRVRNYWYSAPPGTPMRTGSAYLPAGQYRFTASGGYWIGCGTSGTGYWFQLLEASLRPVRPPVLDTRFETTSSGIAFEIFGQLQTPGSIGIVLASTRALRQPLSLAGVSGQLYLDPFTAPGIVFFPPQQIVRHSYRVYHYQLQLAPLCLQLLELDPKAQLSLGSMFVM